MKKAVLFFSLLCVSSSVALAETKCFLATENNRLIQEIGHCHERQSPCSTFKVAISLMGYDSGILLNELQPVYPYKVGAPTVVEACKQAQSPSSWMKNSCVWYSQEVTQKLGMKKFQNYLEKFKYGNQDASGENGKNNGLTHSWLVSSLEISPEEQVQFLKKLSENKLPVSKKSQAFTKQILFVDNLDDGWKLYGKTGSKDTQAGWFVGWIEKGNRKIIFAHYIEDSKKMDSWGGGRAKEEALLKLKQLIKAQHLRG